MANEPFTVLLIEDDPAHAELVLRGLEDQHGEHRIIHVSDGEAALDFLFRRGAYADAPRPHVILLDLRLPKVHGLEVLRQLRASEELRMIPIIVLTTSEAEQDIVRAYDYEVNSYVVKPLDFAQFTNLMRDLGYYWLGWNHYPWP